MFAQSTDLLGTIVAISNPEPKTGCSEERCRNPKASVWRLLNFRLHLAGEAGFFRKQTWRTVPELLPTQHPCL
jgi:hypothetical protein